jgi:UDP-N-acetyl-D-galactosamine dehydrogenase
VGLPLAAAFGRRRDTIGFDHDAGRVASLQAGTDPNGEVSGEQLTAASHLRFSSDPEALAGAAFYIIAVPSPIDGAKRPDLGPIEAATWLVAGAMAAGATVVYESTVYPGCTNEVCIPLLESISGLRWGEGFSVAYSPERINPGDAEHSLARVVKVVGADSPETLERVAALYEPVAPAGLHRVSSIRVAEAAKVIENTQRDLNIALMNELAVIFHRLGIDTNEVLEAAGTKWNFLPFRPGLVGGHCIGVDPYYLTYRAETAGYHPEVVLAGRRINDSMGRYVAQETVKAMISRGVQVRGARVGVLGFAFKENTPDLRNTRVADLAAELESFGVEVLVHDPLVAGEAMRAEYDREGADLEAFRDLDGLVLAVAHRAFQELPSSELIGYLAPHGTFVDVKAARDPGPFREAGIEVWRL